MLHKIYDFPNINLCTKINLLIWKCISVYRSMYNSFERDDVFIRLHNFMWTSTFFWTRHSYQCLVGKVFVNIPNYYQNSDICKTKQRWRILNNGKSYNRPHLPALQTRITSVFFLKRAAKNVKQQSAHLELPACA